MGLLQLLPRLPSKEARKGGVNPLKALCSLTLVQSLFFWSSFIAWSLDAFDFFAVSLTANRLSVFFDKSTHDITTAITLTLLLRSAGAAIFGLLGDRYGRKWVMVGCLVVLAALELSTAYVKTFSQFLAVRSLFGIFMGSIWGLAAASGLENMPTEARGVYSGIMQEGYAFGYLLVAAVNLSMVPKHGWESLFKLGAGLTLFAAILRLLLPESPAFLRAKAAGENKKKNKTFMIETGRAIKTYWVTCIYSVLLMTGFNFFSHGSQDLFPVYLENAKGLSSYDASVATIIGNLGAIVGGTAFGALSQYLGRRLTIIVACIWAACFIPLWILPGGFGALSAGAFFVQVGVQGAWGVVPVYLNELSPPAYRAVFPGLAYQLGNMVSSASAQIEATAGEHLKIYYRGKIRPDYGKIQAILLGVVAAYLIALCLIGPEAHGIKFEEAPAAFVPGAGAVTPEALQAEKQKQKQQDREETENKGTVEQVETV